MEGSALYLLVQYVLNMYNEIPGFDVVLGLDAVLTCTQHMEATADFIFSVGNVIGTK